MKKKLTLLILMALLTNLIAGCAKSGSGKTPDTKETVPVTENREIETTEGQNKGEPETKEVPDDGIRKNGELPESVDDLSEEELYHYIGVIFKAIQELDLETLTLYGTSEVDLKDYSAIAESEDAWFWYEIMGNMMYFEDEDILVYKDPVYLFSKWYMESDASHVESVDETANIPNEEALEAYNLYYEECPYVATHLKYDVDFRIEDGFLKCNIGDFLDDVTASVNYMTDLYDNFLFGPLLMGNQNCLRFGYEYITDTLPEYEELLSLDLDRICAVIDGMDTSAIDTESLESLYYQTYLTYYADEANRQIIQEYLDKNCFAVRDLSEVHIYKTVDYNTDTPLSHMNNADKEVLSDYNVYTRKGISNFTQGFNNGFAFFYELAKYLKDNGALN